MCIIIEKPLDQTKGNKAPREKVPTLPLALWGCFSFETLARVWPFYEPILQRYNYFCVGPDLATQAYIFLQWTKKKTKTQKKFTAKPCARLVPSARPVSQYQVSCTWSRGSQRAIWHPYWVAHRQIQFFAFHMHMIEPDSKTYNKKSPGKNTDPFGAPGQKKITIIFI